MASGSAPAAHVTAANFAFNPGFALALAALAVFGAGIYMALEFAPDSRLVPLLAAIPGLGATLFVLRHYLRAQGREPGWPPLAEIRQIALLAICIAAIPFTGFIPALAIYLVVLLWTCTRLRFWSLPYAAAVTTAAWGLSRAFNIPLP